MLQRRIEKLENDFREIADSRSRWITLAQLRKRVIACYERGEKPDSRLLDELRRAELAIKDHEDAEP